MRLIIPVPRHLFSLILICGSALLVACGGSKRDDPILRLSATEALEEGRQLMAAEKYSQAREYLIHAFEVEPNSAEGREGLLLAADALYFDGGSDNLIEAETRYRDYLNRFPTSPKSAHAQYQIAKTLTRSMERPNRDQATTRKAIGAYEDLMRLYPTSPEAGLARGEMSVVYDRLAQHEIVVAKFYTRYACGRGASRVCLAAVNRLEGVLEDYPDFSEKDQVFFLICRVYSFIDRPEGRVDGCSRLRAEYPDSRYISKIPKKAERKARGDTDEEDDSGSDSAAAGAGSATGLR